MQKERHNESGSTLVEVLITLLILLYGLLAMAQVLAFCTVAGKTYGRDASKSTVYARDKMEELLSLSFGDITTNTAVAPPFASNGTGLSAGGSISLNAPAAGYVDYLDISGGRTDQGASAFTRQWQIIDDTTKLKRILVVTVSNRSFKYGTTPSTAVVTYKTQ
jgi:Tfp pilus assembly protein PilV